MLCLQMINKTTGGLGQAIHPRLPGSSYSGIRNTIEQICLESERFACVIFRSFIYAGKHII